MDGQADVLVREAVREALLGSGTDVSAALPKLGLPDLLYADEAGCYTAFFEEHGYLGVGTNALDIVTAATLGLDGRASFVWPLEAEAAAVDIGGSGMVLMEGAVLRSQLRAAATLLCPVRGRLTSLSVCSFTEQQLPKESDTLSLWLRAKVWGYPVQDIAPWHAVHRLARLAIASEFVGAAERLIDDAVTRISATHLPGSGRDSYRAPSGLGGAVVDVASVKELIAASWADDSAATAGRAVIAAASVCQTVSQRAGLLCDGLEPVAHHPFGATVSMRDRFGRLDAGD